MQRIGKTGQPSFRIVLQEHTDAVKGIAKEVLGHYQPATKEKLFKPDLERIKYWISKGSQVSDRLAVLLKAHGVAEMDKFIVPGNRKRKKKGTAAGTAAAVAPTAAPAAAAASVATTAPAVAAAPAAAPVAAPAPAPTPEAKPA